MGTEFIVSSEYQGYVYVGHALGLFEAEDNGQTVMKPYYNMYVLSPVSTYRSENYPATGYKAEKKSCISPDVFKGLEPGNRVKLFFDDKKRVVMSALDE